MKHCFLSLIALILGSLTSITAQISITGKVFSVTDSQPIAGAGVSLLRSDSTIVLQAQTDTGGAFSLMPSSIEKGSIIAISFVGYTPEHISLLSSSASSLDLGNIFLGESKASMLDEVTVSAKRVIQKVDKYILIPQKDEVERASKAIELLDQMPLPGLNVDRVMKTIQVNGGSPILMVNGKERDINYFANLDPDKILRVEYNNSPGIRYIDRGATGIINFILKDPENGGSITALAASAFTTGFFNGYLNGTYNYKKSQFSLEYNCGYRDYDKWLANSTEQFIGGTTHYISRSQQGINSPMYYCDNTITADYTYMHDPNTMLVVNFNANFCPSSGGDDGRITEVKDSVTWEYDRVQRRKDKNFNPTLDVFFSKKMKNGQTIELNAVAQMNHSSYTRDISYLYEDETNNISIPYNTDNDGWSLAGEAVYGKSFEKISTRFGVQYLHNYAENEYKASGSFSKMKKDNTYIYGEISGKLGKVGYTLGSGAKVLSVNDYTDSRTWVRNLTTASLQFQAGKHWSLRYNFNYTPLLPSLGALSPIVSQTDDITYSAGNPDLKPSEYIRNKIQADFSTGNFYTSLSAQYAHQFNPITSEMVYDAEGERFISTSLNGKYDKSMQVGAQINYKNIFKHFNVMLNGYYTHSETKGVGYKHHLNNFRSNLTLQAYFGNFTCGMGQCLSTARYLYGETVKSNERMSYCYAQYRYNKFTFGAQLLCPFQKDGFKYEYRNLSAVNPGYHVNWTKNNGNMFVLQVVYQANFGKSFKKNRKTLNNKSYDSGTVK